MRSIFVAFRALVYSRARSKGWSAGSRLRVWRCTEVPGVCCCDAVRVRAFIFYEQSHISLELQYQATKEKSHTMMKAAPSSPHLHQIFLCESKKVIACCFNSAFLGIFHMSARVTLWQLPFQAFHHFRYLHHHRHTRLRQPQPCLQYGQ